MNLYRLKAFDGDKLLILLVLLSIGGFVNKCSAKILTNSYLVEFGQNTERQLADLIARRNGFINIGPVNKIEYFKQLFFFKCGYDTILKYIYLKNF